MALKFSHWHDDEAPIVIPEIGLQLRVRLPGSATDGAVTVLETNNAPGFGPPLHRHPQVEVFRVLAGRYLFEVDGGRFTAETGDVVSVPGGAAHASLNITTAPAKQLVLVLPALDAAAFLAGLVAAIKDALRRGVTCPRKTPVLWGDARRHRQSRGKETL
ncbi:MAG TPA: cupin domain-containing protein [bacterium]|nr:cupin domain-containing protein [bacterium]